MGPGRRPRVRSEAAGVVVAAGRTGARPAYRTTGAPPGRTRRSRAPKRLESIALHASAGHPMLYPELFRNFESVRWSMESDVPWSSFDPARLSNEQAQTIKMNAITEWAALPATEMF